MKDISCPLSIPRQAVCAKDGDSNNDMDVDDRMEYCAVRTVGQPLSMHLDP